MIVLPNGDGVRPDNVASVRHLGRTAGVPGVVGAHPARVAVDLTSGLVILLLCETDDDAIATRDWIVAKVREAMHPPDRCAPA